MTVGPKTALWLLASKNRRPHQVENTAVKMQQNAAHPFVEILLPQKQSQFYSLFLLLKTDTDNAFWISVSCISSLVLPFLQKSSATSVIFSAPALLNKGKRL